MKDCEIYEIALSALLDGGGESSETLEAVDHMLTCPTCTAFYQKARLLDGRLDEVRSVVKEKTMSGKLWSRIALNSGFPQSPWLKLQAIPAWARVAAAVFLAVAMAWSVYRVLLPPDPLVRDGTVEVVLESDPSRMNDLRFVKITRELLVADRKYHHKMYEIMKGVTQSYYGIEAERDYSERSFEEEASRESGGETPSAVDI